MSKVTQLENKEARMPTRQAGFTATAPNLLLCCHLSCDVDLQNKKVFFNKEVRESLLRR